MHCKTPKNGFSIPRHQLNDTQWSVLWPHLLSSGIYATEALRLNVEGILYKLRTGVPWRDLPLEFGSWNSICKRFNYWCKNGKMMTIFQKIVINPDHEWTFIDGTIVKAHQHSSGAAHGAESAIGKCVAGNSSKIHLAVDAFELPTLFEVTGGQVHDVKMAPALVDALPQLENFIADKGYDSEALREKIVEKGAISNIPRKNNTTKGNDHMDWCLYKYRHLVENAFARPKHFRSIATRYEKLKRNFEGMICLGCALMWLPMSA